MGRPKKLSREQVLDSINQWVVEHGVAPTIEELRRALKLGSKQTVLSYLETLEEAGDIVRRAGAPRTLRTQDVTSRGVQTRAVPVVGQAPAGAFMLAEQNLEGWIQVPKEMAPVGARYFLLRVRGNSMNQAKVRGEKVENGDLVLVRQQPTADDQEVVVALVDGEATIKRLVRKPGYYILKPESSSSKYRPVVVDGDFRVQGVIVRILKKGSMIIG
jgi:repressor LexA